MSLRLLLNEDSQAKYLLDLLRLTGHDVITVNEAGLEGQVDSEVLNYAIQERRSQLAPAWYDTKTSSVVKRSLIHLIHLLRQNLVRSCFHPFTLNFSEK